ncbi:hypothetical protein NM688_g9085 [Phlebia brevispora]|uniref:Uncharacterized protein n=1 Tax=Phlebia brevispora TaxID=194682 RepID=A0ACC1RN34_9APHY|nr:hypothetical protein NM688_g9085 [Phlebia brevispora]
MSKEEKNMKMRDVVKELDKIKENKEFVPHNVNISSFYDACANLNSIQDQLKSLAAHMETKVIFIAVRDSVDSYLLPHSLVSSNCMRSWFAHTAGMSLVRFTSLTEAFAIFSLQGVQLNREQKLTQLKHKCSKLIFHKLKACATPEQISHMNYTNFGQITESEIKTKIKLELLLNFWKNGATYFNQISSEDAHALLSPASSETVPTISTPSTSSADLITLLATVPSLNELNQSPQAPIPLLPPLIPWPLECAPSSVQAIFLINSERFGLQKKRKKRSDVSKLKGSRKKQNTQEGTNLQATAPPTPALPAFMPAPAPALTN